MKIKQSIVYPMIKPETMLLEDICKEGKRIGYDAIELWDRESDFQSVVITY